MSKKLLRPISQSPGCEQSPGSEGCPGHCDEAQTNLERRPGCTVTGSHGDNAGCGLSIVLKGTDPAPVHRWEGGVGHKLRKGIRHSPGKDG